MNIRASAYVLLCASLVACGGGSSGNASQAAPVAPAAPTTFAGALLTAEATQKTPLLNRDATLTGTDANGNGVRDDIDAYINGLSDTAPQKAALRQMSAKLNKALLVDTTNQSELLAVSQEISDAASCLYAKYDSSLAGKKGREMEKLTINTRSRFNAYDKFNASLNGTTSVSPQGDGCAA